MKKLLSGLCASALAFSVAATTVAPAYAASFHPMAAPKVESQVIDVQHRRDGRRDYRRHGPSRNEYRRHGRPRGYDRHGGRRYHRDFARHGDHYYYRGHRGYRYYRPGYREYNGWWFPAGAFIAGAIVGGALAQPPRSEYRVRGLSQAHVNWCYNRYRSYRAYDNTFQPYNGPRKPCVSPYYR